MDRAQTCTTETLGLIHSITYARVVLWSLPPINESENPKLFLKNYKRGRHILIWRGLAGEAREDSGASLLKADRKRMTKTKGERQ